MKLKRGCDCCGGESEAQVLSRPTAARYDLIYDAGFDDRSPDDMKLKGRLIASIAFAVFDVLVLSALASAALGPSPFDLMWF